MFEDLGIILLTVFLMLISFGIIIIMLVAIDIAIQRIAERICDIRKEIKK